MKPDDVLSVNAAEHFVKGKRQNQLSKEHIATYQNRTEAPRYSCRVEMDEIDECRPRGHGQGGAGGDGES